MPSFERVQFVRTGEIGLMLETEADTYPVNCSPNCMNLHRFKWIDPSRPDDNRNNELSYWAWDKTKAIAIQRYANQQQQQQQQQGWVLLGNPTVSTSSPSLPPPLPTTAPPMSSLTLPPLQIPPIQAAETTTPAPAPAPTSAPAHASQPPTSRLEPLPASFPRLSIPVSTSTPSPRPAPRTWRDAYGDVMKGLKEVFEGLYSYDNPAIAIGIKNYVAKSKSDHWDRIKEQREEKSRMLDPIQRPLDALAENDPTVITATLKHAPVATSSADTRRPVKKRVISGVKRVDPIGSSAASSLQTTPPSLHATPSSLHTANADDQQSRMSQIEAAIAKWGESSLRGQQKPQEQSQKFIPSDDVVDSIMKRIRALIVEEIGSVKSSVSCATTTTPPLSSTIDAAPNDWKRLDPLEVRDLINGAFPGEESSTLLASGGGAAKPYHEKQSKCSSCGALTIEILKRGSSTFIDGLIGCRHPAASRRFLSDTPLSISDRNVRVRELAMARQTGQTAALERPVVKSIEERITQSRRGDPLPRVTRRQQMEANQHRAVIDTYACTLCRRLAFFARTKDKDGAWTTTWSGGCLCRENPMSIATFELVGSKGMSQNRLMATTFHLRTNCYSFPLEQYGKQEGKGKIGPKSTSLSPTAATNDPPHRIDKRSAARRRFDESFKKYQERLGGAMKSGDIDGIRLDGMLELPEHKQALKERKEEQRAWEEFQATRKANRGGKLHDDPANFYATASHRPTYLQRPADSIASRLSPEYERRASLMSQHAQGPSAVPPSQITLPSWAAGEGDALKAVSFGGPEPFPVSDGQLYCESVKDRVSREFIDLVARHQNLVIARMNQAYLARETTEYEAARELNDLLNAVAYTIGRYSTSIIQAAEWQCQCGRYETVDVAQAVRVFSKLEELRTALFYEFGAGRQTPLFGGLRTKLSHTHPSVLDVIINANSATFQMVVFELQEALTLAMAEFPFDDSLLPCCTVASAFANATASGPPSASLLAPAAQSSFYGGV